MDWFVVNARDAQWKTGRFGTYTQFESPERRFEQVGMNICFLKPGEATGLYHREANQEDFLVLAGECLVLVEEQERVLRAWDLFHCPPATDHILIGAGEHGCTIVGVGSRSIREVFYAVSELALRHSAGVTREADHPRDAYAGVPEDVGVEFDPRWLPS